MYLSAIGLEKDGKLTAGVLYDYYNKASVNMHVVIEGNITRSFLFTCFWYPFVQLGVKRVTGLVPEDNLKARRFDEHLGFILEARLKDAAPHGDMLVYRMLREECKWIKAVQLKEAA